jgi:hypothetical protein
MIISGHIKTHTYYSISSTMRMICEGLLELEPEGHPHHNRFTFIFFLLGFVKFSREVLAYMNSLSVQPSS